MHLWGLVGYRGRKKGLFSLGYGSFVAFVFRLALKCKNQFRTFIAVPKYTKHGQTNVQKCPVITFCYSDLYTVQYVSHDTARKIVSCNIRGLGKRGNPRGGCFVVAGILSAAIFFPSAFIWLCDFHVWRDRARGGGECKT